MDIKSKLAISNLIYTQVNGLDEFYSALVNSVKYIQLTIIARKRAWYRLILSRRGRRPSWLKLGDITQAWAL